MAQRHTTDELKPFAKFPWDVRLSGYLELGCRRAAHIGKEVVEPAFEINEKIEPRKIIGDAIDRFDTVSWLPGPV